MSEITITLPTTAPITVAPSPGLPVTVTPVAVADIKIEGVAGIPGPPGEDGEDGTLDPDFIVDGGNF